MDPLTPIENQAKLTKELFKRGYTAGRAMPKPARARMIACGMGGSILGAELFQTFAQSALPELEISVWQTYGLPNSVGRATADAYCISYSGNTEETLSAFRKAYDQGTTLACLAGGGTLAAKAKKMNVRLVVLPETVVPRQVAPFVFGFFVGLYCRDAKTTREVTRIALDERAINAAAARIAIKLAKKQVLVYTPISSLSLAHLWEIHLNETAGLLAFGDDIPDIDHHTLAALNNASERSAFHALFLESTKQSSAMRKRIDLTKRTLGRIGIGHSSVAIKTNSLLESLLSNTAIASLSAIAIARKTRFNPFTNTIQDSFKKNLRIRP